MRWPSASRFMAFTPLYTAYPLLCVCVCFEEKAIFYCVLVATRDILFCCCRSSFFNMFSWTKCQRGESNRRLWRHLHCPATKWLLGWRPAVFSWHRVQIVGVLSWHSCQDVRKYTMSHTLIQNIRTRWEPARRSDTYYRTDPVYRSGMSRYMAGSSWKHHPVPQEIGNSNFKNSQIFRMQI